MNLEEFQRIIYTTDSTYADHFDEYVAFYEFVKDRITPEIINIKVKHHKNDSVFTLSSDQDLSNMVDFLNNGELSLFGYKFNTTPYMNKGSLVVKLNKVNID